MRTKRTHRVCAGHGPSEPVSAEVNREPDCSIPSSDQDRSRAPTISAMGLPSLIKEIGRGARGARGLPPDRAHEVFAALLDGTVPELERGAILLAYRIKGESP